MLPINLGSVVEVKPSTLWSISGKRPTKIQCNSGVEVKPSTQLSINGLSHLRLNVSSQLI